MKNSEIGEVLFIKLKKSSSQKFLRQINHEFRKQLIIDQKFKIIKEKEYVLFPLVDDIELVNRLKNVIEDDIGFQLIKLKGDLNPKFKPRTIKDALKDKFKEEYLELIPTSYDIVGDIAIIEIDDVLSLNESILSNIKREIACALTLVNKNVKSVYEKRSEIKGSYRVRDLKHLYGEKNTSTVHKENDCIFNVDIATTFFTPRLVFERERIASSNIKRTETIIDLFAGVGPFSVQIAKNHDVTLHSFDVNPHAYNQLKKNVKLNKFKGEIFTYNIDVKDLLTPGNKLGKLLKNKADRIIMNLPERSLEFIDVSCFLMKKAGGILHNYQFCEKPNPIEGAVNNLKENLEMNYWKIGKVVNSKIVKAFSPKSDLVVLDVEIKPLKFNH